MTPNEANDVHETVGAYALGILDDREATAFENHLAGCDWCTRELEELAGMEPMLAALADLPGAPGMQIGTPDIARHLTARPSPRLADRLVDEVTSQRALSRRRSFSLVAAAAVLIIGGPVAVVSLGRGDDSGGKEVAAHPTSPAEDAFFHHMEEKIEATDTGTRITATVGLERKAWGTHTVLELKNLKGPEKCSLIAVGKNGERETVTTWSVPAWGYGIPGATRVEARKPLYVHGGAALSRDDIDHFEVRTLDGRQLVRVRA
ncbi:anti-sigma factor family protein [Streptomyces uncialis]|uniref:anti-sigma factor family protein n=1 Tax=Streptomyces uncialis TaxID=1048205 RepID=UPI0038702FD5|nr:zf-HC2 domain-containing protein [Streptomyces uncialis]